MCYLDVEKHGGDDSKGESEGLGSENVFEVVHEAQGRFSGYFVRSIVVCGVEAVEDNI